jgi:hypothetical protein
MFIKFKCSRKYSRYWNSINNLNFNAISNPQTIPYLTTYINWFIIVNATTILKGNATASENLNVRSCIIGSGSALTNLNYNSISNPPTISNFNSACTLTSSLCVSGTSIF